MAADEETSPSFIAKALQIVSMFYRRDRLLVLGTVFAVSYVLVRLDATRPAAWRYGSVLLFSLACSLLLNGSAIAQRRRHTRRDTVLVDGDLRIEPARRRDAALVQASFDLHGTEMLGWRTRDVGNLARQVRFGLTGDLHAVRVGNEGVGLVWFDGQRVDGGIGLLISPAHRGKGLSRRVLGLVADHLAAGGAVPEAMTAQPIVVRVLRSIGFAVEGRLVAELPNGRLATATLLRRRAEPVPFELTDSD